MGWTSVSRKIYCFKFIHEFRDLPSQPFNKSRILKPKFLNEATPTGLTNTLSGKNERDCSSEYRKTFEDAPP